MAFADRGSFTWLKLLNTNNTRGSIRRKGIDQAQIHSKGYNSPENLNVRLCGGRAWTFCPNDSLWVRPGSYCVISSAFFPARLPGTKQQQ